MDKKIIKQKGYTLIEAMIATTIASIMSLSVISIYVNQSSSISIDSQRDSSIQEANRTYDLLSRLLKHAKQNTITIQGGQLNNDDDAEAKNDSMTVQFELPEDFNIWPNNTGDNPAVEIHWQNTGTYKYLIQIRNAASIAGLSSKTRQIIAGDNKGAEARIVNLDVWPMQDQTKTGGAANSLASSGYLLRVTTRTAQPDLTYQNPDDDNSHYRTHSVAGIVAPRN